MSASDGHERGVPVEGASAAQAADELLSHGLLEFARRDGEAAQTARIERVIDAVRGGEWSGGTIRRWAGVGMAVAASVVIAVSVAMLALPRTSSAQAIVRESVAAMRRDGERRYVLRAMFEGQTEFESELHGVVDMRAPDELLIRGARPDGGTVVVGRDSEGDWAIRRDGAIERERPERAWPKWAMVGDEALFAQGIDRLLELMAEQYDLTREAGATLEGRDGATFERINGVKRSGTGPGAGRMDVWIDEKTRAVERVEMRWDEGVPRPPVALRGLERRWADDGPDGGPTGGPPRPRRGPRGPHEEGARGERPPPLPPPGAGATMPPPRRPRALVLDRVDSPEFAAKWFSPEWHREE